VRELPKIKDELDKIYINEMRSYLNALELEMQGMREKEDLLDELKGKAEKLIAKLKEYDQVNNLNLKEVVEVERVIAEAEDKNNYMYLHKRGVGNGKGEQN
jgi:small nuclear ribonucleoprotein (snRNP)-like protein